jgi:hypothetical protein
MDSTQELIIRATLARQLLLTAEATLRDGLKNPPALIDGVAHGNAAILHIRLDRQADAMRIMADAIEKTIIGL